MTFVLDEAVELEHATLRSAEGLAQATIDHCLSYEPDASETNRVVAWLDPASLGQLTDGALALTLELSDLAGTPSGALSEASLIVDSEAPEPPAVDTEGLITLHRTPWGTDTLPMNSARVTGLPGAATPGAQVSVYDSPNLVTAQLLNQGDTFGTTAKEDGGFDVLLTPGDRAEVYIQTRDKAGEPQRHEAGSRCRVDHHQRRRMGGERRSLTAPAA